ncbi:hypothetical protein ELQ35_21350 [Peribacillus cavernae]|uniref:Superoxide dismutase [Cu-Zn] n=1 Tax=Peribacillus cavernae TaxID=1674310 RepID=A0A433H8V5_9BACI|nr:superoxide dismutase family protein [Peribacillus cavernae]MDQ0220782.1 Cu-Zn family superoxide dismutase [Peribacillus cavernae]RUQ24791.1 hypothetical protein ELQ35_21350 [Peribacillus cavernae]
MSKYWTKLLLPVSVVLLLMGCAGGENSDGEETASMNGTAEKNQGTEEQMEPKAKAEIKNVDNKTVGTVSFFDHEGDIQIKASMKGLEPGLHGFHVHEKGACEPDAKEGAFTTAGGHFNPDDEMHSGHNGDMPSLYVNEEGTAEFMTTFDRFTINQLTEQELAIIVHEKPDNSGNIPDRYQAEGKPGPDDETMKTGDAGKRQACGIIMSAAGETK